MKSSFKEWFCHFGEAYLVDRAWISILFATPLVYFYGNIFEATWGMPRLAAGIAIIIGNIFRSLERIWQAMFSMESKNKILAVIFVPIELLIACMTLYFIVFHYVI